MGKKLTTAEFISKAVEKHGDKYDYSKVEYINNRTKVCIICPEHGEFWQKPDQHMLGQGCKKCGIHATSIKNTDTKESFIEKAKQIHGDKYDYSKVNYVSSREKVCIKCPEHGEFWQRPNDHLNSYGCPKCGRNLAKNKNTFSTEEFIEKSRKIHGEKYDYSKVEYVNSHTKICIICPEHGEFWQMPYSHMQGIGCPSCSSSRLEEKVRKCLLSKNIDFCSEKTFKWLNGKSLDFFLPEYNTAIECQGDQHFEPVQYFGGEEKFNKQKQRDKIKFEECKKHNIPVIYYVEKEDFFGTYLNEAHNENELISILTTF